MTELTAQRERLTFEDDDYKWLRQLLTEDEIFELPEDRIAETVQRAKVAAVSASTR